MVVMPVGVPAPPVLADPGPEPTTTRCVLFWIRIRIILTGSQIRTNVDSDLDPTTRIHSQGIWIRVILSVPDMHNSRLGSGSESFFQSRILTILDLGPDQNHFGTAGY